MNLILKCFSKNYSYFVKFFITFSFASALSQESNYIIEELYPSPYKAHLNYLENKDSASLKSKKALIDFLATNCEAGENTYVGVEYCKYEELLKADLKEESVLREKISDEYLILENDDFFSSLLMSSSFEFNYKLDTELIEDEVVAILQYIKSSKVRNQNFKEASRLILDKPSVNRTNAKSTILSIAYAYDSSTNTFESLLKFFNEVECTAGRILCDYSMFEFYKNFYTVQKYYVKEIIEPAKTIFSNLLNSSDDELDSIVERRWALDTYNSYMSQDFDFFLDLALHSSGHSNDEERAFKKQVVKVLRSIETYEDLGSRVAAKAFGWSYVKYSNDSITSSIVSNKSYQEEFLNRFREEAIDSKLGFIKILNSIDQEVLYENKN